MLRTEHQYWQCLYSMWIALHWEHCTYLLRLILIIFTVYTKCLRSWSPLQKILNRFMLILFFCYEKFSSILFMARHGMASHLWFSSLLPLSMSNRPIYHWNKTPVSLSSYVCRMIRFVRTNGHWIVCWFVFYFSS